MNVVLIGYRGTGKSAVARLVAEATGRSVFGMDDAIARRAGCSISEFVARRGWEAFRDLESEVACEAGGRENTVIDTGGGVVLRPENIAVLKKNGRLVWLRASAEVIAQRIQDTTDRPSLTGAKSFLEEIGEVLLARTPLYQAAADLVVSTEGRTVEEVAHEIAAAYPGPASRD
ncbi:MAG: shikimate kinase [Candidatus Hydrogenedentes bacterium]|nr:shikimate kinase [Candidatus Hydrogenedentota bacterium]